MHFSGFNKTFTIIYMHFDFLEDAIEKDNFTSAKRMIQELGGWPVLKPDWKENTFNLIDLLSKTQLYTNNPPLIYMYVHDDSTNPTRNTLYVRIFLLTFTLVLQYQSNQSVRM